MAQAQQRALGPSLPARAAPPRRRFFAKALRNPAGSKQWHHPEADLACWGQPRGLVKYDLSRDVAPATLASLGRQITTAAKAAGQNVTLPRAAAGSAAAATSAVVDTQSEAVGQLKVTA